MSFDPAAWTGESSFGAVTFNVEEFRELDTPEFPEKTIKGVRSVPYASPARSIVQITGRELGTLTLTIKILTSTYASLKAKTGTTDTLTLNGGTPVSGVLLDALGAPGFDIFGLTTLSATFISG